LDWGKEIKKMMLGRVRPQLTGNSEGSSFLFAPQKKKETQTVKLGQYRKERSCSHANFRGRSELRESGLFLSLSKCPIYDAPREEEKPQF